MRLGFSGPEDFVRDPQEARFICEVLAETASNGSYKYERSYRALRSLAPQELFELYDAHRKHGNEHFRNLFGPYYHRQAGESVNGPLFEKDHAISLE